MLQSQFTDVHRIVTRFASELSDLMGEVAVTVCLSGCLGRDTVVGLPRPRVEFVARTPDEWRRERDRGTATAVEAIDHGRVLRGALD